MLSISSCAVAMVAVVMTALSLLLRDSWLRQCGGTLAPTRLGDVVSVSTAAVTRAGGQPLGYALSVTRTIRPQMYAQEIMAFECGSGK
jgi:hypothetical protein